MCNYFGVWNSGDVELLRIEAGTVTRLARYDGSCVPGWPSIVVVRASARNGRLMLPPWTVTVCFVGACSHQSVLASVTRIAIRWPAASFQSADQRSSVIGPLGADQVPLARDQRAAAVLVEVVDVDHQVRPRQRGRHVDDRAARARQVHGAGERRRDRPDAGGRARAGRARGAVVGVAAGVERARVGGGVGGRPGLLRAPAAVVGLDRDHRVLGRRLPRPSGSGRRSA